MRAPSFLALVLSLSGCSAATPEPGSGEPSEAGGAEETPSALARPELQPLDDATAFEFAGDATGTVPARWSAAVGADGDVLFAESPEGDLSVIVLAVPVPQDGGAHLAERVATNAWRRVDPTFDQPVLQAVPGNAGDGWDVVGQVIFENPPSADRWTAALLQVKDGRALVALVDGRRDGLSRRGAQLGELAGSLRLPGIERENWMALERKTIDEAALDRLAERIEAERLRTGVPGVAVALVRSDEVLLLRGFGTRGVGEEAPVTPQTRFMIGSTTKALTTLLAAKLVDQGALRWDQPLVELLPQFALAEEEATANMTVADAFCACTGLPRRDLEFLFEYADASPAATLQILSTVAPTTERGETFQYSNFLVAAGGWAVARARDPRRPLDVAFARLLEREILQPLGMGSTTLDSRVARRGDHANPSVRGLDGEVGALPPRFDEFVGAVGPSGAAWSTAEDMARYLQLELRRGALDEGRLLSEEALLERREPRVAIGTELHYGLGLIVGDRSSLRHAGHGGNTIGFTSNMIFYPELDLGLAVLVNLGGADSFAGVVDRMVIEAALPIATRAEPLGEQARRIEATALAQFRERIVEASAEERAAIAGDYESEDLGPMTIRVEGDRVTADVGEWSSALRRAETAGERNWVFAEAPLTGFPIESSGDTLTLPAPQHDYVFTRTEDD